LNYLQKKLIDSSSFIQSCTDFGWPEAAGIPPEWRLVGYRSTALGRLYNFGFGSAAIGRSVGPLERRKVRPAAVDRRPFRDFFREFETERSVRSSCTEKMNDRAGRELSIDVHVKDVGVKTSRLRPLKVDSDDAHYANDFELIKLFG
jgi:hypothetical protein